MTDPKERQAFLKAEARSLREPETDACDKCDGTYESCECSMTEAESRQIEAELREDD